MKKFFAVCLLCLCMVMFTGCASSGMLIKENLDGSVETYYVVDLKYSSLVEDGTITSEDFLSMKSAIEAKSSEIIAKVKYEYKYNIANAYKLGKITEAEKNNIFNEMTVYTGWDKDVFAVKIKFETSKAYLVYTNFGSESKVTSGTVKSFWYTKYYEKTVNPFGKARKMFNGKSAFEYFKQEMSSYLSSHFSEAQIAKFPKFEMVYSYVSTNPRLHSDADVTSKLIDGTLHAWNIEDQNQEIVFDVISANKVVWYLLALDLTFMALAIYLVVIYFKR